MPKKSRELMASIARKLAEKDRGFKQILPNALANEPSSEERTDEDNKEYVKAFATSTPDLVVLIGYLSASSDSDWRRLSLDAAFRSWLLLKYDDILHEESFTDEHSAISDAVAVWLKADAKVGQGNARTHNPLKTDESRYL